MVKGNAPQSGHSYQIVISQSLALPDRLRVEEGKIYEDIFDFCGFDSTMLFDTVFKSQYL